MQLSFLGAARQVTGSMFLLQLEDGYQILIDCGTDMERKIDFDEPVEQKSFFPFDASLINLVILYSLIVYYTILWIFSQPWEKAGCRPFPIWHPG